MANTYDVVPSILAELGIENTETNQKQMRVYLRAFAKFIERNAEYYDLWREGGVQDSLFHCRHKLRRMEIMRLGEPGGNVGAVFADSAEDLINYAAFALRNLEDPITTKEETP